MKTLLKSSFCIKAPLLTQQCQQNTAKLDMFARDLLIFRVPKHPDEGNYPFLRQHKQHEIPEKCNKVVQQNHIYYK
jgi:hypothetical protein